MYVNIIITCMVNVKKGKEKKTFWENRGRIQINAATFFQKIPVIFAGSDNTSDLF